MKHIRNFQLHILGSEKYSGVGLTLGNRHNRILEFSWEIDTVQC